MPFFDHAGLKHEYFEVGEGPPVLLIHGWGGRARRQWHKTIVDLRGTYHFYAISLRGHGHSEELREPDYDWASLVADCEALRQLAGVERWMVVGYSFGGIVGLQYASMHPDRVVAACAISPLIISKWLARAMRRLRWPVAWVLRLARKLPPALSGKMLHNVAKTRLRTLFHTVDMMYAWQPRKTAVPASVPVIIILGEEDRSAHGERAIAAAPKADVRMLADTDHFPLWRRRERFVQEMRDVLQTYVKN